MATPDGVSAKRHQQMVERRRQVAAFRLAGVRDQGVIAARLGVTQPTISKDFAALNARWEQESVQDVGAAKGQDLERLEELLLAVWQEAKRGDLDAVARALDVLKRRAGILGYDAPKRVENTGKNGAPMEVALSWADAVDGAWQRRSTLTEVPPPPTEPTTLPDRTRRGA